MFCTEKLKLYTGAKIVTLYDPMPIVEAVCVIGERIHAMGSLEDMERCAALCGEYEKIDLGGGVLYPGFIDTHSHLSMYADTFSQVYCGSRLGTVSRVLDVLREAAGNTPQDRWIVGYAYDDTGIDEKRHLTREDLDAVSTERPILVKHLSSSPSFILSGPWPSRPRRCLSSLWAKAAHNSIIITAAPRFLNKNKEI